MGFQMYIMVSSKIIRIRQECLLEKLVQLNAIRLGHSRKASQAAAAASDKWRKYLKLNDELLSICRHTAQYRHQNVPTLSVLVPFLMLNVSYATTVALFGDRAVWPICAVFNFESTSWLYMVTRECAQIDRLNGALEREMRRIYNHFCAGRMGKRSQLAAVTMLKAQLFQNSDRLHPFVFSLLGDFRITSETFPSVRKT